MLLITQSSQQEIKLKRSEIPAPLFAAYFHSQEFIKPFFTGNACR